MESLSCIPGRLKVLTKVSADRQTKRFKYRDTETDLKQYVPQFFFCLLSMKYTTLQGDGLMGEGTRSHEPSPEIGQKYVIIL